MRRLIATVMLLGVAWAGPAGAAEGDVAPRIVGSPTDAVQAEWPFMAVVSPDGGLCGGSVVSSRWVMTAAHCTFSDTGAVISRFSIFAGAYRRTALPPGQGPDAVRVHPSYRPGAFAWDFALMRLPAGVDTPVAALPAPGDDAAIEAARAATPLGARNGRIAGWGSTGVGGAGPWPDTLQSIASGVPVLVDSQCTSPSFQAASMICAGGYPTSGTSDDTCKGDSGGPLAIDIGGRRVVVGLTSFGPIPCGNPAGRGVYAKVQAARDWICDTVTSPTAITATGGRNSVLVSWSPDTGTCPWRDPQVRVTMSPGGASVTAPLSSGTVTFTGLPRSTGYTFSAQVVSSAGAQPPAANASATTSSLPDSCTQTFFQQDARTARTQKAPDGTSAVRVVSRLRIYEDAEAWCRVDLTFIFRNTRTGARLAQLPGSTLGFRKLTGKDFSAPVVGWPTAREFRFEGSDSTELGRKDARLVLVSFLRKTSSMPSQSNIELVVVRRIPRNPAQASSAANPLFAQVNAFGTATGWAAVS